MADTIVDVPTPPPICTPQALISDEINAVPHHNLLVTISFALTLEILEGDSIPQKRKQ